MYNADPTSAGRMGFGSATQAPDFLQLATQALFYYGLSSKSKPHPASSGGV